jgi:hypothetical protein
MNEIKSKTVQYQYLFVFKEKVLSFSKMEKYLLEPEV